MSGPLNWGVRTGLCGRNALAKWKRGLHWPEYRPNNFLWTRWDRVRFPQPFVPPNANISLFKDITNWMASLFISVLGPLFRVFGSPVIERGHLDELQLSGECQYPDPLFCRPRITRISFRSEYPWSYSFRSPFLVFWLFYWLSHSSLRVPLTFLPLLVGPPIIFFYIGG